MAFGGISTNTALVVASAAEIQSLLQAQLSQIHAAEEIANVQGQVAKAQATATINAGNNQAEATRDQSYVALTQAGAAGIGATFNISALNESRTILSERDTQLNDISLQKLEPGTVEPGAATADTAENIQHKVDTAERALRTKTTKEAKAELEKLQGDTLTTDQYNKLQEAHGKKEKDIKEDFENKKGTLSLKSQLGQNMSSWLNGLTVFSSAMQASNEAAKAEQDAMAQVAGSSSQQTQQSFQEIVQSRQALAQEITKVLDATNQALQAVNLRS